MLIYYKWYWGIPQWWYTSNLYKSSQHVPPKYSISMMSDTTQRCAVTFKDRINGNCDQCFSAEDSTCLYKLKDCMLCFVCDVRQIPTRWQSNNNLGWYHTGVHVDESLIWMSGSWVGWYHTGVHVDGSLIWMSGSWVGWYHTGVHVDESLIWVSGSWVGDHVALVQNNLPLCSKIIIMNCDYYHWYSSSRIVNEIYNQDSGNSYIWVESEMILVQPRCHKQSMIPHYTVAGFFQATIVTFKLGCLSSIEGISFLGQLSSRFWYCLKDSHARYGEIMSTWSMQSTWHWRFS